MAAKKQWYTEDDSQKRLIKICDIRQNFSFYRILNNENFKMEVEQVIDY